MKKKIQVIPSGIPLVDKFWGGLYRSGTYFLIGRRKSGKTLLSLQYAMESAKQRETCLLFTTMRPKDLMIHAASIDFDIQQCMDQNLIIVIRVSLPENLHPEKKDEYLLDYLNDIISLVRQYRPARVVFDEFTPFIEFHNLNLLKKTFSETIENIEDLNVISLFVLGEPASAKSKNIVDLLTSLSTGTIYLEKEEDEFKLKTGIMIIIPNIGHIEGKYSANYYLEPYKGITIEQKSFEEKIHLLKHDNKGYKNLCEIELPDPDYNLSNLYSFEEFRLLVNNQIAVYKSIHRKFSIISFQINPEIEGNGLLSLIQLQNAVRLSLDKKDKFCVMNNKILILILKNDMEYLNVIAKVKTNLPSIDPDKINEMLKGILVYTIIIDDTIESADDMFKKIFAEENLRNGIRFT